MDRARGRAIPTQSTIVTYAGILHCALIIRRRGRYSSLLAPVYTIGKFGSLINCAVVVGCFANRQHTHTHTHTHTEDSETLFVGEEKEKGTRWKSLSQRIRLERREQTCKQAPFQNRCLIRRNRSFSCNHSLSTCH